MRTGADSVRNVRELLHDTGRTTATANYFFSDDQILRALVDAKTRTGKVLLRLDSGIRPSKMKNQLVDEPTPQASAMPAMVTASVLIRTFGPVVNSTSIQPDFAANWGGIKAATSAYVPPGALPTAEAMQQTGHDVVLVRGGKYRVTSTLTVLYAAQANQPITNTVVPLGEFTDGVYDAIEFLAARELLSQEESDATDRWQVLTNMFIRAISSFN